MVRIPLKPINYTKINKNYACKIIVGDIDAKIEGTYPVDAVISVTSYYPTGYQFTSKFRSGFWDGRVKLFSKVKQTFPSGLVQDVYESLKKAKVKVQIEDQRVSPPVASVGLVTDLEGVSFNYPFEYQPICARKMLEKGRGVIGIATNGGKTQIAIIVIATLKVPTLFMVPNKILLYQTQKTIAKRLRLDLDDVGIIGDGNWKERSWITVATVDTLYSRLATPVCVDFLNRQQLMIVDEVHSQASNLWYKVSRSCKSFWKFGMSGTAYRRTDGADLRLTAVVGPLIYEMSNKELIQRGISLQPIVHLVKIDRPDLSEKINYKTAYELGIVDNVFRTTDLCKVAAQFVDRGLSVLILVDEIKHGEIFDRKLWTFRQKSFYTHQFISGRESMEVRHQALIGFINGDLKILIASDILSEGLDIPNIDVLVLAGGKKSPINLLQRIGRGLRKGGKSEYLHIVDTADFQNKYLLKHSLERMKEYEDQDCFLFDVMEAV